MDEGKIGLWGRLRVRDATFDLHSVSLIYFPRYGSDNQNAVKPIEPRPVHGPRYAIVLRGPRTAGLHADMYSVEREVP